VEYAKDMKPIGLPGETWHYADTNYVLLGMVIEAVTGRDLQDVFRRQIFRPLGMDVTYLSYRESPVSDLQESHRFEHTEDLYDTPRQSADWAGGGLVSNVEDLQTFMRALLRGELFAETPTLDLMMRWIPARRSEQSTRSIQYGMGLFRVDLAAERGELWGHDGWGNAFMYYWPEEDILFTGTLNQAYNDWFPLVMQAVDQWIPSRGQPKD
jgi:CubicO group peptidase (beta-lactamase class C family)